MAVITPTVTTSDPHEYREQLELIDTYADGVHIDFADGTFAPTELLPPDLAWRPDDCIVHVHVMYQKPLDIVDDLIVLEPDLVILHAESDEVKEALELLQEQGVRTGIALLPETSLKELQELDVEELFDHVLVFGGHLGYQGAEADLSQLDKVIEIREAYPDVEIGWDGGIGSDNVQKIAKAGVDVLNVGGYLHSAENPQDNYKVLQNIIQVTS